MDSYYTGEQRTTRGFMRMALQGLRMIDILSGELGDTIRGAFVKPPLLQLSAHAILAVLNTLVWPVHWCKALPAHTLDVAGGCSLGTPS